MAEPWLCTREQVKRATDSATTAAINRELDAAIAAASVIVREGLHLANIRPLTATKTFDWPEPVSPPRSWRLWLNDWQLVSVTTLTSGGTVIASTDYRLWHPRNGPPYRAIEIDLSSNAYFQAGDTWQDAISVAGLWGHSDNQGPAGALAAAVADTTSTTVTVSDGSLVGVGDLLTVNAERMTVTERGWTTSGTDTDGAVANDHDSNTVTLTDASGIQAGEDIQIDSETMHVLSVTGNDLSVIRGHDGTGRATHTDATTVNVSRSLTVERGARGSTAATHADTDTITKHLVDPLAVDATIDVALIRLGWKRSGHQTEVGARPESRTRTRSNTNLDHILDPVRTAMGRQTRIRSI